ncbi:hypothetical protein C4D60_Mb10t10990 [Musa balbisiana]|uniref:Divalent-cation tolerance protein CutA n=1 Tax=Musa balbisiana TaxID=52838 RepID=A0A4S8IYQ0_MUSBA|nr:hypothetical protein C4D60_Mb10t10990 [Musa balbisiana]
MARLVAVTGCRLGDAGLIDVETDAEELLIIKTRESLLGALTQHVKSNHEYDVPEVISLPITGGNERYLQWIKDSTRDD